MDMPKSGARVWRTTTLKLALGAILASIASTASPPTRAQWIVADPAQISNSLIEYGQTAARWGQTLKQWSDEFAFWQEQLVKIQSLNFQLFTVQQQFPKLPADFGVKENCPGASGGGVTGDITSGLRNLFGSITNDITTQQQNVCVMIELTKNQKYEGTRKYLQEIGAQGNALQQLANMRIFQIMQSPGKLSSYTADTTKYAADMTHAREVWQTNQAQLDMQIAMLERRQSVLSRQAINGQEPTTLGTLVNMAALKAALTK